MHNKTLIAQHIYRKEDLPRTRTPQPLKKQTL